MQAHDARHVLLIEDNTEQRLFLSELLAAEGYRVAEAADGVAGLAQVRQHPPDLIIVDGMLPGMSGFEVVSAVKADPQLQHIPVILATALDDRESMLAGLDAGAEDFLAKPIDAQALLRRVRNLTRLKNLADMLRADKELLADFDAITCLPNREVFQRRLAQGIGRARQTGRHLSVTIVDLDHFKHINDSLGFANGDAILKELGRRLSRVCADQAQVFRLGGDRFGLIHNDSLAVAQQCASEIEQALKTPFEVQGSELFFSVSQGIACYSDCTDPKQDLLSCAESALCTAKGLGGRRICTFTAKEHSVHTRTDLILTAALHKAVAHGDLHLVYQPQVNMIRGELLGVEALARWHSEEFGTVPPGRFIALAEASGDILALGDWVLGEACRQCRRWQESGWGHLRVAVNVSPEQFKQPDFYRRFRDVVIASGVDAGMLEVEVTESGTMDNVERSIALLGKLRKLGVRLSIDDFGTGYSSLSYLQHFPITALKIDQSFVREIADPSSQAIVRSVLALAHGLRLEVVAEGIETRPQHEALRAMGCEMGQGYYYAKPMDASDVTAFAGDRTASA